VIDLSAKTVSTLCGTDEGHVDGKAIKAKFSHPTGITVDDIGCLYVTEAFENVHRLRCILILTGHVSTPAGGEIGGYNKTDVKGSKALFNYPTGLCFLNGCIYLCDKRNSCIRCVKVTKNKRVIDGRVSKRDIKTVEVEPEENDKKLQQRKSKKTITKKDDKETKEPKKGEPKKGKRDTEIEPNETDIETKNSDNDKRDTNVEIIEPEETKETRDPNDSKELKVSKDSEIERKDSKEYIKISKDQGGKDQGGKDQGKKLNESSSEEDLETKIQRLDLIQVLMEENNSLRDEVEELKRIVKELPSREEFESLLKKVNQLIV